MLKCNKIGYAFHLTNLALLITFLSASAVAQSGNVHTWNATYTSAHLNHPTALYKRPSSQGGLQANYLFIADTGNNQIKLFDLSANVLTVVAGSGVKGYVDGSPTSAQFSVPAGLDGPGYLTRSNPTRPGQYSSWVQLTVYDTGNNKIREICIPGNISPPAVPPCAVGTVSTITGNGITAPGQGIGILSPSGPLYFANSGNHQISLLSSTTVSVVAGNGSPGYTNGSLSSAQFTAPTKVVQGPGSILYVADAGNYVVRAINTSTSQVSTFAGSVRGYQDGPASSAKFSLPVSVAYNSADGYTYVADTTNNCIRRIDSSGNVSTYAGATTGGLINGSLSAARFSMPTDLLIDGTNMYVSDSNNNAIRLINMSTGVVSTLIQ